MTLELKLNALVEDNKWRREAYAKRERLIHLHKKLALAWAAQYPPSNVQDFSPMIGNLFA